MQWGERTETKKIKPGLTESGAAKPTQWILSWADGAFSLLGQDEGAAGRDPQGFREVSHQCGHLWVAGCAHSWSTHLSQGGTCEHGMPEEEGVVTLWGVCTAVCLWDKGTRNTLIFVLEGNSEILSCSLAFASAQWCASVASTFWNSLTAG